MLIVANLLLMGGGVSRYKARLEGQRLELKLAIKGLATAVDENRKQKNQDRAG